MDILCILKSNFKWQTIDNCSLKHLGSTISKQDEVRWLFGCNHRSKHRHRKVYCARSKQVKAKVTNVLMLLKTQERCPCLAPLPKPGKGGESCPGDPRGNQGRGHRLQVDRSKESGDNSYCLEFLNVNEQAGPEQPEQCEGVLQPDLKKFLQGGNTKMHSHADILISWNCQSDPDIHRLISRDWYALRLFPKVDIHRLTSWSTTRVWWLAQRLAQVRVLRCRSIVMILFMIRLTRHYVIAPSKLKTGLSFRSVSTILATSSWPSCSCPCWRKRQVWRDLAGPGL